MDRIWDDEIVPVLTDYIRIPNKSPAFDSDWDSHGHMEQAVAMFADWARAKLKAFPGAEIPGTAGASAKAGATTKEATVLMYGHLDKQPEMLGWADGTGPWQPLLKDDKLYGRGGADDGYALFASIAALLALKQQGIAHGRAVIVIEASEESGSPDLPYYMDHLAARIGTPSLVVCLDSGAGNYDQLWLTTSLRGNLLGNLTVRVLTEGVHSGAASGIVPSSFRILRALLSRIEDEATGRMKLPELFVEIPQDRQKQAIETAAILGDEVWSGIPFAGDTKPMASKQRQRQRRSDFGKNLAAATGGDGDGRLSPARQWRQCAAALFHHQDQLAPAAHPGGRKGAHRLEGRAGSRPALRCASDIRRAARRQWLERAHSRAMAGDLAQPGRRSCVRQAGGVSW